MDPVRQLNQLWSWLPAFRVVAETEHLPSASELLGVTPQALSHAVKRLEESTGTPLFDRVGRRMRLNQQGAAFLQQLRIAMRTIDEGIVALRSVDATGPARVAARSHDAWLYVEPALRTLQARHPGLVPQLVDLPWDQAQSALKRGTIDVAIGDAEGSDSALVVEELTTQEHLVVCGAGHPLYGVDDASLDEVIVHPFVVPTEGNRDSWPATLDRQVGAKVDAFPIALKLCLEGHYLAFVPRRVVAEQVGPSALQCFDLSLAVKRTVYMSYRRPVSEHRATDALLEALRQAAG